METLCQSGPTVHISYETGSKKAQLGLAAFKGEVWLQPEWRYFTRLVGMQQRQSSIHLFEYNESDEYVNRVDIGEAGRVSWQLRNEGMGN